MQFSAILGQNHPRLQFEHATSEAVLQAERLETDYERRVRNTSQHQSHCEATWGYAETNSLPQTTVDGVGEQKCVVGQEGTSNAV